MTRVNFPRFPIPGVMRTLGFALVALALFTTSGGHLMVLQSVAWAQMIRDFAQEMSVAAAIEKTFSGKAPCSLCVTVSEGRKSEQKLPTTVANLKKIEVFVVSGTDLLPPPDCTDFSYPPSRTPSWAARGDAPSAPVPRSVLA